MYLVKSLSRDKGSGRYTMYLPFSPYRFLGAKGTDTLCICRTPCPGRGALPDTFRSAKSQNEISPNFSIFSPGFCPEFCSEFSPNFSRIFRASFRGKRRPEKIHQKSPSFFNAKFPSKYQKNIHKNFLENRKSKIHGQSLNTHRGKHRSGGAQLII